MAAGLEVFKANGDLIVSIGDRSIHIVGSFNCPGASLGQNRKYTYYIPPDLLGGAGVFAMPEPRIMNWFDNWRLGKVAINTNSSTGRVDVEIDTTPNYSAAVPEFDIFYGVL